jgi:hypothetical protein
MSREPLVGIMVGLMSGMAFAAVPGQINHQGVIRVNGDLFTGTGQFRFAIFDPDTGQNYWTNDNTFVPGPGTPTAFVPITVTDGVYSVRLGDTSLTGMTNGIPTSVFNDSNAALRVWFNDGVNGIQQFDPHPLTTSPYSHRAASVDAKYLFQAYSQGIVDPPNGDSIVSFAELSDPSGAYNGTDTFTVPVSGFYFLSTNITFNNGQQDGTNSIGIEFSANGAGRLLQACGANMITIGTNGVTQGTNGILQLTQGDTVRVRITNVGSPILYDYRSFSGFLIGQP